ncbi:MAG TPA: ATP-binding cassette domain-containing protein [Deinococcales bacterium]|nr:ATP-binding cassette domain-containing protein [Deinococcales bacterium]
MTVQPAPPAAPAEPEVAESIVLEGAGVEFDGRTVLRDVNLRVRKGEFIAVIGPSGGGKSTLLRVIAGLLKATGRVDVAGRPAMVFQDHRLLPWQTVRGNVALPLVLTGQGDDADAVLKRVGMTAFADLYPHQLSGGMRSRVAIARALAQRSEVLLMDEPFAALDALVRERFNEELKRLHARTGKTIVLVTHSIREAVYLADRVVLLRGGSIECILDSRGEGRITAFTDGLEAQLRERLGVPDSTLVRPPPQKLRAPWELLGVAFLTAAFLLAWTLIARTQSPLFFPPPEAVLARILTDAGTLAAGAFETLRVTAAGTLLALAVGIPSGYWMGRSQLVERLFSPSIVALQAIPTIVVAPILVLVLGYGLPSRLIVTALICLYPVLVSSMVGVREVDRVYREVFKTIGANWWGIWTKLEVPGALPVVLGGLRLTLSLALIGTIVGESVFGPLRPDIQGLGVLIFYGRQNVDPAGMFAAAAVSAVLGALIYMAVSLLENWFLRYRRR